MDDGSSQASPLADVVTVGDRRRSLEALRDRLGATLDLAVPREVAPLAAQLRAVLAELDGLPTGEEVSAVDDLASRRAARRAAAGM